VSADGRFYRLGPGALRSIADEWADFRREAYHIEASASAEGSLVKVSPAEVDHGFPKPLTPAELHQVEELRRAFYAGVACFYGITVLGLTDERITEAAAQAYLERVRTELRIIVGEVAGGR
jgi:hypothetical protein